MLDLGPLVYWTTEREAIRVKRARALSSPWTDDPILATYRFCNVRREDDRVTIWIRKNIRGPFADHPHLWFMLAIARWINWPDTLHTLINAQGAWPSHDGFTLDRMLAVLNGRQYRGEKVFTGAYTINAPPTAGASKIHYVAETVLGAPWRAIAKGGRGIFDHRPRFRSMQSVHRHLMEFQGWGPFMAYQVVVDMRFTSLLDRAEDRATWCAAGPGTLRGLNRLHHRPLNQAIKQDQARDECVEIFRSVQIPNLDLSDVPNMLCETDKYLRVKNHEGTPRARYVEGRGY